MNIFARLASAIALATLGVHTAFASTAYGDLNNFDVVNDTGQDCHGFEIEIEGAYSTDVTYTYDWNHYGAPRIFEDRSDPAKPRVVIRYESQKNPDGSWASYTAVPVAPLTPTDGHSCTNPYVNDGCEHFGVGYYGAPTAIKYHWLIDDGTGALVRGPAVGVATPTWFPVAADPALPPDPVANPIVQVVAAIPAPVLPAEPIGGGQRFGEPTWVKVIKTTTHNANNVALEDLVSDDIDGDGLAEWQNQELDVVETEWSLLQMNDGANPDKDELAAAAPDEMPGGDETVTRRYEFYKYNGDASTIDGETGEAMCDEVGPDGIHGKLSSVGVTDANGVTQYVDCTAQAIVGDYIGAQMAGFDVEAPLGLVGNLQDAEPGVDYTPRTVVIGGNTPFDIVISQGALPEGMSLGDYLDAETGDVLPGVLSGIPTTNGLHAFTVQVTDADGTVVSRDFTLQVGVPGPQQFRLVVDLLGSGTGAVTGSGIDCGTTCEVTLDAGTLATLTATPAADSEFAGWSGACSGTGDCSVALDNADASVTALFNKKLYSLAVTKSGTGTGTVSGNGIDCGPTCSAQLVAGTSVSLTATPDAGSVFTGWSGACTGTGSCNTVLNGNTAVTAAFAPLAQSYTLSVTRTGSGSVSSSPKGISCGTRCSASFKADSNVTLTAKPAKKHLFLGWGGACSASGTALTCTVKMTSAQSVTADFN